MEQLTFKNLEIVRPEFPVAVLYNDRINHNERVSVCHPHWHEQLELVPYATTRLRIAIFPIIEG